MQTSTYFTTLPPEAYIYDTIIIGAGQAGLALGYYLKQKGLRLLILDKAPVIGQTWLDRYDSLRLFTPAEYCCLPGFPLSLPKGYYPTKTDIAVYLQQYALHFQLPVLLHQVVQSLTKEESLFNIQTETTSFQARQVVVATGAFQVPYTPSYAAAPEDKILQLHSAAYRNPAQIPLGKVLVVGAGNSGAQIAVELAKTHEVHLSVKKDPVFSSTKKLGLSVFWWGTKTGILYAPKHSRTGKRLLKNGDSIYGLELQKLLKEHRVLQRPAISGFSQREVLFQDGTSTCFSTIIWATGFRPDYSWIQIEGAVEPDGTPIHQEGISPISGLFYMGLPWQRSRSSALMLGAGRDAQFIAQHLE